MPVYIVTRKSNGAEVYRYNADTPIEFVGFEFATHDHAEVAPQADATPAALFAEPRRMTKLQFVGLMTQEEFVELLTAAKSNPAVEMFIKMLDWTTVDADGTSIDRDDPRTVAGVRALFSPARADQILGVL